MPEHGQDGPPEGDEVRAPTQRIPSWATPDEGSGEAPRGAPPAQPGPYGQQYAPPPQYGPPGPYGQQYAPPPEYGPPAPRHRRRWIVLVAVAVVVVAAGVTAFLLLRQGVGTRVLSASAVERDVAEQFQQKQGVSLRLTCTDRMTLVDGGTYHCSGVTGQGESVTVTIRVTDAKAATYTWTDR